MEFPFHILSRYLWRFTCTEAEFPLCAVKKNAFGELPTLKPEFPFNVLSG